MKIGKNDSWHRTRVNLSAKVPRQVAIIFSASCKLNGLSQYDALIPAIKHQIVTAWGEERWKELVQAVEVADALRTGREARELDGNLEGRM